jgi:hypothetical protein
MLEVNCTQENVTQPGVSFDHFVRLIGSPPAGGTAFDDAFRRIDPTRATRIITVASFGAFLIVPNVAGEPREYPCPLSSRTARAHNPISYVSTSVRSELNNNSRYLTLSDALANREGGGQRLGVLRLRSCSAITTAMRFCGVSKLPAPLAPVRCFPAILANAVPESK